MIALIDRMATEEVDGTALSRVGPHDINEMLSSLSLVTDSSVGTIVARQWNELVQRALTLHSGQLAESKGRETSARSSESGESVIKPYADASCHCSFHLPELAQSVLEIVVEQVPLILDASRPPARDYLGRYPSDAAKRVMNAVLSAHRPQVIVLWGEQEHDQSFLLYSHSPDALILHMTSTRSDSVQEVEHKLSKRSQALENNIKRGPSHNIHIKLPPLLFPCALHVLMSKGVQVDLVFIAQTVFPLNVTACEQECGCNVWNNPKTIIMGTAPHALYMQEFAEITGGRIYHDAPLFVLSHPGAHNAQCADDLGHGVAAIGELSLLGAYMIVKNEAGGMAATMRSLLPHIDYLTVLDTGSEDGTPDLIEQMMHEYQVKGKVHHGVFTDFSTTRNQALQLASQVPTVFTIMLNGDDELRLGNNVRKFLEPRQYLCGPSESMYLISIDYEGHKMSWSERLMRTSNHRYPNWPFADNNHTRFSQDTWHYEGLTHEVYTHPLYAGGSIGNFAMTYAGSPSSQIAPGTYDALKFLIWHTYVRDTPEKLKARAVKDVQLLLKQLESLPDDPRTLYYISHSLDIQEEYAQAYPWHERRVKRVVEQHRSRKKGSPLVVADQEECTCLLRLGKIAAFRLHTQPGYGWEVAETWLKLTRELCPQQIEARYYLGERAIEINDLKLAHDVMNEAEQLLKSGKGMMHVLESETVQVRTPPLIRRVKELIEKRNKRLKNNAKKQEQRDL